MKQTLLTFAAILLFTISYGQNEINNVKFIFNNLDDFTSQFSDKENSKFFTFSITDLNNEDAEILLNTVNNYRGVVKFEISDINSVGSRDASLELYKYADHWKYYEFLFSKNGVRIIIIDGVSYNPAQIGNQ